MVIFFKSKLMITLVSLAFLPIANLWNVKSITFVCLFWKKTVVAVLDRTVNPHWPYLPDLKEKYSSEEEKEVVERTWSTIPDDPLNYHFYYQILEGDECGRPPKIQESEPKREIVNQYFNNNSTSCLSAIAKSQNRVSWDENTLHMF